MVAWVVAKVEVGYVYAMHVEPHDALSNYVAIQDTDVLEQVDGTIYNISKLCRK